MSDGNLVRGDRRHIGRGGLKCGPIAFGCWRFTHTDVGYARRLVEHALSLGMDLVDTADIYGTGYGAAEELLGRVLQDSPGLRDRLVLATKGGILPGVPYDSSGTWLRRACEASLRRLQVESVDLYQVHRPDLFGHPEEVAKTLLALRSEGKVREIGVSNYSPSQYDAITAFLGPRALATFQPELSAAVLEPLRDGTLDRCMRDGVTPLAWSPLAGGRIASGEGLRAELLAVLDELAGREGVSRTAISIAFLLAHPSRIVPIAGTQQNQRLDDVATAVTAHLDRKDCYRIIEASEGKPLP